MKYFLGILGIGLLLSWQADAIPYSQLQDPENITTIQFKNPPPGVTFNGAITSGHCVSIVDSLTIQDSGNTCGNVGNGQINSGTGGLLGYYATTGVAISPLSVAGGDITFTAPAFTINSAAVTSSKIASSVALAGSPTTTTPVLSDNTTKIATTAYVQGQGYLIGSALSGTSPVVYNGSGGFSLTGPSNLSTFTTNAIPKGAGTSAFAASSILDTGSGVTIGSPAGGTFGAGTLNATNLFVNGIAVGTGSGGISGLTNGQLGIASGTTSLGSSIGFGTTATANSIVETTPAGTISASLIPNTTVSPGSCSNCTLSITADGRITAQATGSGSGGGSGITGLSSGQLAIGATSTTIGSSVAFGPTGVNTVVQTGVGGHIDASLIPDTAVAPGGSCTNCNLTIGSDGRVTVQSNGTSGGGITGLSVGQLGIADTTTSLGSSIQYGPSGANTIVETNSSGNLVSGIMPAFSGDASSSAGSTNLTLALTGVTGGDYQFGSACATVDNKGRLIAINVATCGVPANDLTADDGTTVLTADDGATALTDL